MTLSVIVIVTMTVAVTATAFVALTVTAAAVAVAVVVKCPGFHEIPHHRLRKPQSLYRRSRPTPLTSFGCRETETQAL